MARRTAARAANSGGASIPALHASRARLSTAAAAYCGCLALAIYPWLGARQFEGLLLLGGVALLLLVAGLVSGLGVFIPSAIGALGLEWIISLYLRVQTDSLRTAVYGAALLLIAELAYWSLDLRTPSRDEVPFSRRRVTAEVVLVAVSLGIGLIATYLSQAPISGSLALLVTGLGALVTALAIVAILVWRPRVNRS